MNSDQDEMVAGINEGASADAVEATQPVEEKPPKNNMFAMLKAFKEEQNKLIEDNENLKEQVEVIAHRVDEAVKLLADLRTQMFSKSNEALERRFNLLHKTIFDHVQINHPRPAQ